MLSHDNLVSGAVIVADYLGLSAADKTLALLPWSFDYGLNQVLATFAASGAVVIQRSAFPPDICRTLASAGITGMAGVPTLWAAMTGPQSPFLRHQYPCLRYLTNSGGTLPVTVIRTLRAAHPGTALYAMYGLTEAFRSTFLNPALIDAKPTAIGRPIPNTDVLVIDDHGAICPPGAEGQFVHRGPTVAMGYWRDPAATAAVFRPRPAGFRGAGQETVVYTGDYGHADADGDLYFTGRRDEIFKSRGIRVTPAEIEAEIMRSGMISDLVVTAAPDGNAGTVILLTVQPGDRSFSLDALQDYCRTELAVHMRPHRITVMNPIPRTPHGKIDRPMVRRTLTGYPTGEQAS
jgi:acyl-CoA synthetase (AMP-forming)/AMP-acid ligase II